MTGEARVAIRLLLQHHPLCGEFAVDRVRVLGVPLCSGCVAAVPAAALGFVLGLQLIVHGAPSPATFAAGSALGLPHLTTYLRRGDRAWRFAAKALGGLGLGAVAMSALVLPVPTLLRLAGALAVTALFLGLQGLRVRSILATCDACPYARDWDACPGFRATVGPLPPPGGHQGRPKPLKLANDTSSRNAGPAHRG